MKKILITTAAVLAFASTAFATDSLPGCKPSGGQPKKCDPVVVNPPVTPPTTTTNNGGNGGNGGSGGNGGNGGNGYGVGIAGAAAGAAASSSASNHTAVGVGVIAGGGSASIYGGNGAGGVGGAATTTSGPASSVSGPATTFGGSADVRGGTIGAQTATNSNAGINGQGGSASVGGVGNGLGNFSPKAEATIEKGAVVSAGGAVTGSGNLTIEAGAVTTVDPNSLAIAETNKAAAIRVAEINNGINPENGQKDRSAEETALFIADIEADARIEAARLAQTIKNTPSVSGPALTSSNDTCMGSSSGSANVPGIGIGFGTSWVDANCKMLKNSRELWNMGMKAASLALMCNDADNRAALELTGFECPQTTAAKKQAAVAAAPAAQAPMSTASGSVPYTGNDPIVRARYGLK